MTIIRVIHNRENPYVQLNKKALWDDRLSLKAIGLWAKCLSRPDNWKFNISELEKSMKEGKRAIYSAIDELIKHGYAFRYQISSSDKKRGFHQIEYVFFEFSITPEEIAVYLDELKKSFPCCGFAHTQDAHTQNAPLLKKEDTSYEDVSIKEKERERGASPPNPPNTQDLFIHERVKMPKVKYDKLVQEFGQEKISQMVDRLEEYADINPKRFKCYACHSTVIRKWIREDNNKPANFSSSKKTIWKLFKAGENYNGYEFFFSGEKLGFFRSNGISQQTYELKANDFNLNEKFEYLLDSLEIRVPSK